MALAQLLHLALDLVETGSHGLEHVLNVLSRLNASPLPACVETSLQLKEAPLANTGRYDDLREVDEAVTDTVGVNHD